MHQITVMNVVPETLASLVTSVKSLTKHCKLNYRKQLVTDPDTGYEGPLFDLPEGVYDLWQEATRPYMTELIATAELWIIGGRKIVRPAAASLPRLPEHVWAGFKSLLSGSERSILAYIDPNDVSRQQEYLFIFPDQPILPIHPIYPDKTLAGKVDLETGLIMKITP